MIGNNKTPASSFSLQKSDLSFESTPAVCNFQNLLILTPRDQYRDAMVGRDGRDGFLDPARLTITLKNKLPGGSEPIYDRKKQFVRRLNCLLLPFVIEEAGSYTATISDHYVFNNRVLEFTVIDPAQCLVWGPGACSSKPEDIVDFWVKLQQGDGSNYFPPADSPIKIDVLVTTGTDVLLVKQLLYTDHSINASYAAPSVGVSYSLDLSMNGVPLARGSILMRALSSEPQVDARAATLDLWSTKSLVSSHLGQSRPGVIAENDEIEGQIVLYERSENDEFYRWRQERPHVVKIQWPNNSENIDIKARSDGAYPFHAKAGKWGSESEMSVTAADGESAEHCRGSPCPIRVQPRRQLSQVVPNGTGLCSGYDEKGVIRIKGYDQYGALWPVTVNNNCQIMINYKNKQITWTIDEQDADTITFRKPARAMGETYLVTIGPKTAVPGFPEVARLVSLADRAVADPPKTFVSWKTLRKRAVSVAEVFVSDQLGQQYCQGGDDLVIQGVKSTAPVTPMSVHDNDDGKYTLQFILPDEAFDEYGTTLTAGDHPQLSITLNGIPILGSPFSFPPSDKQMVRAHIVEDDYYTAYANKERIFTLRCIDKHGITTDRGLHSYGAFHHACQQRVRLFSTLH